MDGLFGFRALRGTSARGSARERIRGWRRSVGVENGVDGVVASHHEVEVRIREQVAQRAQCSERSSAPA